MIQCENVVSLTVKMEVVKPVMPWWMKNNRIGTVRKPIKNLRSAKNVAKPVILTVK